jgi:ABC-type transporter Mla MlaB component
MATSEEDDLIGYDPLAWMESNADKKDEITDNNEIVDGYSDDLTGNSEESATLSTEDELLIDEIGCESDNALDKEVAIAVETEVSELEEENVAADGSVSKETDKSLFDLDATLSIQNVVKLHEQLKDFLAIHDQIEINASDVSSIDTATLQLLVSLKKDAAKLQKDVTIIYPSPRFIESTQLLGLLDVLDIHDA